MSLNCTSLWIKAGLSVAVCLVLLVGYSLPHGADPDGSAHQGGAAFDDNSKDIREARVGLLGRWGHTEGGTDVHDFGIEFRDDNVVIVHDRNENVVNVGVFICRVVRADGDYIIVQCRPIRAAVETPFYCVIRRLHFPSSIELFWLDMKPVRLLQVEQYNWPKDSLRVLSPSQ